MIKDTMSKEIVQRFLSISNFESFSTELKNEKAWECTMFFAPSYFVHPTTNS